jgi:AcrR family transcriptional regulator
MCRLSNTGEKVLSNQGIEKQDPRITRTRSLILQAFERLLVEKGFHALSVQAIAERAGINRATFYAHFADKYALLDFSIQETFQQALEKRTLNACQYSPENLHALIAVVCEFIANAHANCSRPEAPFESLVEAQVKRQVQGLLRAWLEEDVPEEEAKIAATAASWAIYGLALAWSQEKKAQGLPAEQFAQQILPLVALNLRGVREK